MSKLHIPPELRTASIVPRWSIVWTLNRDTVTNHSWFVVMYSHEIARIIDWRGNMAALMYSAATHDLDETITGDIVSPVKREIIDNTRAAEYIDVKMHERLPNVMRHIEAYEETMSDQELTELWVIVKVADRLDALLFLLTEKRMGNGVIDALIPKSMAMLEAAWQDLPCNPEERDRLWATYMSPSIAAHKNIGGDGV